MFPYNFTPPYDNTQVTVELRQIVESGVDVWAFDYPSYYKGDEKAAFEKKVLNHYWLRQIGQETVGRWLHYFRSRMCEIMPYYIQLYESQALMHGIEDPFGNVDIVETYEEERTEQTSGTSETENIGASSGTDNTTEAKQDLNQHKFSNTPQGSISNLESYMTEASIDNNQSEVEQEHTSTANTSATSTGTATGTASGTTKHTFTKKGNQGVNTYAHDMKELRDTFLNIDLMIINELKDLFLQVY